MPACKLQITNENRTSGDRVIGRSKVKIRRHSSWRFFDHPIARFPGFYCENTILPGETPVVKAFPVVAVTSPLEVLYV